MLVSLAIALTAIVVLAAVAIAQGNRQLPWFNQPSATGHAESPDFQVSGSIGPLAGDGAGTEQGIASGFWGGVRVVQAAAATSVVCGDLNGNSEVDVLDAIFLMQIVVGNVAPTEVQSTSGDLDQRGSIDVLDLIVILQHLVGRVLRLDECGVTAEI